MAFGECDPEAIRAEAVKLRCLIGFPPCNFLRVFKPDKMLQYFLDITLLCQFVWNVGPFQPEFTEFDRTDFMALIVELDVSGSFRRYSHCALPLLMSGTQIALTGHSIQFWDNPFSGSDCLPPILRPWRLMQKTLKSAEYARLIDLLVAVRQKSGVRQQALAKKLGRPQSFIAKYEGGERRIDVIEFIAIVRALDVDPVKLFRDFVAVAPPLKAKRGLR
jgi:Helix-turn-helix